MAAMPSHSFSSPKEPKQIKRTTTPRPEFNVVRQPELQTNKLSSSSFHAPKGPKQISPGHRPGKAKNNDPRRPEGAKQISLINPRHTVRRTRYHVTETHSVSSFLRRPSRGLMKLIGKDHHGLNGPQWPSFRDYQSHWQSGDSAS